MPYFHYRTVLGETWQIVLHTRDRLAPTVARTCPKLATDLALIQAAFSGITADQIVAKQK